MDSRERVIRALTFQGPDRVPVMHRTLAGAFRRHGEALEALYRRYPGDVFLSERTRAPFAFVDLRWDAGTRDAWGSIWLHLTDDYGGQAKGFPLADWKSLAGYRSPDPRLGYEGVEEMLREVRADGHRHYVMADGDRLFQRMWYLRGYENVLMDLMDEREELFRLRDMIVEYLLKRIEIWCQYEEVDGIMLADDWGTQRALMIRPELWDKHFKESYRRLVTAIHAGGKYAHLHTDGYTLAIIPGLIEIGFDEINPQLSCMEMEELGRVAGGKVCVRADLDRQWALPFGEPADVEAYIWRAFRAFGRGFKGGYIGYGQIGADVPLENAEAMLKTFWELR